MTHSVAVLLHYLADRCVGDDHERIERGYLRDAMPEARRLKLVESPDMGRGELDNYWLRLTSDGRFAVEEMLAVGGLIVRDKR